MDTKPAHEYPCMDIPGKVDAIKVFGWKCDHCSEVHVAMYMRLIPTAEVFELMPDAEPTIACLSVTEEGAKLLMRHLAYEVQNPAPGSDCGFIVPEFSFPYPPSQD